MEHPQSEQMKQLSQEELQNDESRQLESSLPKLDKHEKSSYGNLKVFSTKYIHLSIGPDYCFSIFAFGFLLAAAFGLAFLRRMIQLSTTGEIIHWLFVLFSPSAFIATLLSNPGIYDPDQNYQPKRTYCNICKVFTPKRVYHCKYCNICIEDYDHHCPWLSKCIGKKNIKHFYVFISSISFTFFYFCYLIWLMINDRPHKQ